MAKHTRANSKAPTTHIAPIKGIPVLQGDEFPLHSELDNDNVLALAMSRAEDVCQEQINNFRSEQHRLGKEIDAIASQIQLQCNETAQRFAATAAKQLNAAFKSLKYDPITKIQATTFISGSTIKINGKVLVAVKSHRDNPEAAIHFSCDAAAPTVKLQTKRHALEAQVATARDAQYDWRHKLDNLDSYERKAKGRLAAARLNATETGRQVLSMLNDNVVEDMKRLSVG